MLSIILPINITVTLMFLIMKHPLSMGLTLLIQTMSISLITSNLNQNSWFSYILFLIMIGGMLILFMYMTSVASNEKFKMNFKISLMPIITLTLFIMLKNSLAQTAMNNETENLNNTIELNLSLNKFINPPLSLMLIFLMIYLLLALIVTVKMTEFKQGSIRQMN